MQYFGQSGKEVLKIIKPLIRYSYDNPYCQDPELSFILASSGTATVFLTT